MLYVRAMEALTRAIEVCGSQAALARAVGVKQAHIWNWLNRDKKVPGEFVMRIEQATGGQVTRYELRPDIFGEAAAA